MAPGHVPKVCSIVSTRANKWSVIDCGPRTLNPKVTVGSPLCNFNQKDRCKCRYGIDGRREHAEQEEESTSKPEEGGHSTESSNDARGAQCDEKGRYKNRCNLCDEITDPPHWAATGPRALAAVTSQRASSSSPTSLVQGFGTSVLLPLQSEDGSTPFDRVHFSLVSSLVFPGSLVSCTHGCFQSSLASQSTCSP